MELDIGNIVSVIIGGLLVFGTQWFSSRQHAKVESIKWQHQEERERGEGIRRFREQRARPVFEALDRAAHRWDIESFAELADMIGFEGTKVDFNSEEYKQRRREQKRKYFEQLQADISAADIIHDDAIRRIIKEVLYASVDPDLIMENDSPTLKDAYVQLEKWIFEP